MPQISVFPLAANLLLLANSVVHASISASPAISLLFQNDGNWTVCTFKRLLFRLLINEELREPPERVAVL